jgi:transglutaminase-like putative cysteine protease
VSFRRLHKGVTYLVASLGLYGLTLGAGLSGPVIALAVLGVILSWWAEGELIERPGYTKLLTVVVFGVFALQALRGVQGESLLGLGIEFAAFLQITRLLSRRSARDYQQVAILALLHLICASVLSTDLDFALSFLGFLIVTPWMLSLTHLRAEVESNYRGRGGDRTVQRVLGSRRLAGPGLLFGTAFLAVPLFVATAGLFLLFPRVGMGFLSFDQRAGISVAGFGRNVELGRFGVIRDDPTVILRVTFPDGEGSLRRGRPLRLRGTSFDHYDGRQWTRRNVDGYRIRPIEGYYPVRPVARMITDHRIEIDLDPMEEPVIFTPPYTVGVVIPPRIEGGQDRPRVVRWSAGEDLRYMDGDALGLRYTAFVSSQPQLVPELPLTKEARERYLLIPEDYSRIEEQARSLTDPDQSERSNAMKILRWLRESGEFEYSLQMPDVGDRDPLHVFLFDVKRAHCEYFSTALAIMLRAVEIPARNVTGFVGGRYNEFGEYYAIRNGDAHSWVEAFVDGHWMTLDPTPAARAAAGPSEGPLAGFAAMMDALRSRWVRNIVGYDLRAQASGFRSLLTWMSRFGSPDDAEAGFDSTDSDVEPPTSGQESSALLIVSAVLMILLFLLWRGLRGRIKALAWFRTEAPSLRAYRRMERMLAKKDMQRPSSRTATEHLRYVQGTGFEASVDVEHITKVYLRDRFGGGSPAPQQGEELLAGLKRIRSAKPPNRNRASSE